MVYDRLHAPLQVWNYMEAMASVALVLASVVLQSFPLVLGTK